MNLWPATWSVFKSPNRAERRGPSRGRRLLRAALEKATAHAKVTSVGAVLAQPPRGGRLLRVALEKARAHATATFVGAVLAQLAINGVYALTDATIPGLVAPASLLVAGVTAVAAGAAAGFAAAFAGWMFFFLFVADANAKAFGTVVVWLATGLLLAILADSKRRGDEERSRLVREWEMKDASADVAMTRLSMQDLVELEKIERRSFSNPWSRSTFVGHLQSPGAICLGAFERETKTLVGYLFVARENGAWHIVNLAVNPGRLRRGIAKMLLQRMFELTANDSSRGYKLEVAQSNLRAIHLYERTGFRTLDIRSNFYVPDREDALIMWKDRP